VSLTDWHQIGLSWRTNQASSSWVILMIQTRLGIIILITIKPASGPHSSTKRPRPYIKILFQKAVSAPVLWWQSASSYSRSPIMKSRHSIRISSPSGLCRKNHSIRRQRRLQSTSMKSLQSVMHNFKLHTTSQAHLMSASHHSKLHWITSFHYANVANCQSSNCLSTAESSISLVASLATKII
jgi:hypothetical protein